LKPLDVERFFPSARQTAGAVLIFYCSLTRRDAGISKRKLSNMSNNIDTISAQIANLTEADRKALLAKVSSAAIHPETERRIKRALNGLAPSENHDRIVDAMCAEGVVRNYLPGEYHASAVDAIAASAVATLPNNDMPLLDRVKCASENKKKAAATRACLGLLRRLAVPLEACESRATLAEAIKGLEPDKRIEIKSALAFCGILN
jgi:outer membrane murein-binding lipoprotein Lpp